MKRTATALIALLAVLALASAAGSFTPADQPSLDADGTPQSPPPADAGPPRAENESGQPAPTGEASGQQVNTAADSVLEENDSSGVSPLFVAVFVGALIACAVLAVVLTGDDDRTAPPDDGADGSREDPLPALEVNYRSPSDNAVIRAWQRLTEAVGESVTETPRETARRATEQGFPPETAARLRDHFRAVRYGDEPPESRERDVRDALETLDGGDDA